MSRPRAILLAGPTASGKSAAALALAETHRAVVVNADSMQVYRELRILTARPTAAEEARAEHRLYGHVGGAEPYSVGRWVAEVADLLADCEARGRPVVIVGGTGLYFKALIEGLSPMPAIPPEVRARMRALATTMSAAELHALLSSRDGLTAARLDPSDPQRIVRALEVLEATGRPLAVWQEAPRRPVLTGDGLVRLLLTPPRDWLRERIDRRLDAMIEEGALGELRDLLALGLSPELPIMRALGVPSLAAHLKEGIPLEAALADAKTRTRQYAKRQETWFRHQLVGDWHRISGPDMAAAVRAFAS
ncbi:MAG: tRNA (adenosine(37)-N6)-dimethylallyltransferase MiaA [Hyphomicrobiaceae bacterium]